MNNHTDTPDVTVIEEVLKQIVHEEPEENTIKATENKEQTRPKLSLEDSLKQRIDKLPEKGDKMVPLAISRIPANVRWQNRIFYEPEVVSIGPFYRGRESLRAMEEQKIYLLRDFLARYPETDIKVLVKEMRQLEDRARQCYAESINLDSREFVKMLLLDGCFILENAIKWLNNEPDRLKHVRWTTEGIFRDLFLVENQIPFFVITKLISLIQPDGKNSTDLLDLLVKFIGANKFLGTISGASILVETSSLCEARNLLHLYYQHFMPKSTSYQSTPAHSPVPSSRRRLFSSLKLCIYPQPNKGDAKQINEEPVYVFPCATELLQSGIILKPKKSSTDLLDITFQDGVLEMPPLYLDPHTKVTFLNIVAFEQSNGENEFLPFSSYVALMENLVKRSKDVVALRQCGIIYTFDPSEREAARFFNHAGHVVVLDPSNHYFANLFREIKFCYDTRQSKFKK
ncbi:hypothetical protein LUZ62_067530 [Rhynchospora pubera]|uniref:Uncharacterized protein n=1 Tax=Rhynchospora pubera TaxID=906938 RepID=A0AAV8CR77_9POAL|nr:hypothetical protein LUZ62_000663 [Rhynchospora pubera]KAJ4757155.1 hypothetical protein LUZ62_067530 [Rhynchospora pubera]